MISICDGTYNITLPSCEIFCPIIFFHGSQKERLFNIKIGRLVVTSKQGIKVGVLNGEAPRVKTLLLLPVSHYRCSMDWPALMASP